MNASPTEKYGEFPPRLVALITGGLVILLAATVLAVYLNRDQLSLTRVFLYLGVLGLYLSAERLAYRQPQPGGRRAHEGLRYALSFSWWALAIGSPLVYALWPVVSPTATVLGVLLTLAGLLLRVWAVRTLAGYFSGHIETWPGQTVVQSGPYRWIRHPAYAGNLLQVLGMPLVLPAFPALLGSLWVIALFLRRLSLEEAFLRDNLPGYEMYMRKTKRLIPGLW